MGCLNTDLNKLGSKEVYSRVYDYFKSNFPTQEKTISKQSDSLDVDKYSEGSKKDLKIEMMTQDFIVTCLLQSLMLKKSRIFL